MFGLYKCANKKNLTCPNKFPFMFNNLGPQLRALVRLATGLGATVISELFWQILMGAKWKTIKLQGEKEMDLRKV